MTETRFYEPARQSTSAKILVFTKTAGRHNLVEVVVILKVFLIALAANLKYN